MLQPLHAVVFSCVADKVSGGNNGIFKVEY